MIKAVFLGTPAFAIPSLEALCAIADVSLVVTAPEDPRKGPSPVAQKAAALGIKVLTPPRLTPELFDTTYDIFVIAAYGKILKPAVLSLPKHGVLNVHPSLLPKHRGASPIQSAILAGDKKTGISLLLTDADVDHGPLLAQESIDILASDDSVSLTNKLSLLGASLLTNSLPHYIDGSLTPREQDHKHATFTKLLSKNESRINWTDSAFNIERLIRAYRIWPTAWTTLMHDNKTLRLRIEQAHTIEKMINVEPGTLLIEEKSSAIVTGEGILVLDSIQPEGRTIMTGSEFARGYLRKDIPIRCT
ncbi:MAG: methionyl-tRNA formyltransferase [Patescibacteria group bacterium]